MKAEKRYATQTVRKKLVLLNGRPLSINWAAENVPAILEAWEPGTEGGHAVADVLFGDVNPGGTLPVTFPRAAGHAPLYLAQNVTHSPEGAKMYNVRYWDGAPKPLYPFGHVLSYTTFSFAHLKVAAPQVKAGATTAVTVDVTYTGAVAGDEVVQLYVHQRAGSDSRPVRELKGFRRISLNPSETQAVTFSLGPEELRYWSTSQGKWVQDPAAFDVWIGRIRPPLSTPTSRCCHETARPSRRPPDTRAACARLMAPRTKRSPPPAAQTTPMTRKK